jgi:hypothetical protein
MFLNKEVSTTTKIFEIMPKNILNDAIDRTRIVQVSAGHASDAPRVIWLS